MSINIWRLHLKTSKGDISDYCIKNNIAAIGWSLSELPGNDLEQISNDFSRYCSYAEKVYGRKNLSCVYRFVEDVKPGDLIWIRNNGKYYIGRVSENSRWLFNTDAIDIDAANQLTDIDWIPATDSADESSVPGAVATSFIRGSTFQRINKSGVRNFSAKLYNKLVGKEIYKNINIKLRESDFYSLLLPSDAEDLLCMWLYHKKQYICIPSTNKISTPLYECVLLDTNARKRTHIYIQVKKGKKSLKASDYKHLNGEVYLLTTEGQVTEAENFDNIHVVSPTELFEFATNPKNAHIIPEKIYLWIHFLGGLEESYIP